MVDCPLCAPDLGPILYEGKLWRLVLNRDQRLLGKCFLVARRHVEAVADPTQEEWCALHLHLARVTCAIVAAFQPVHLDYAFLQNQDRHVHLHVIPRYREKRSFAGLPSTDPDCPAHYSVPSVAAELTPEQLGQLTRYLTRTLTDMPIPANGAGWDQIEAEDPRVASRSQS